MNFGELAKPGEGVYNTIGGVCALVQAVQALRQGTKNPRRSSDPGGQSHSFDCPKYGDDNPVNLLECLYLYREFESEAL